MTNQLVPVFNGNISNESTLLANARDLHEFLGVRRDFSTWIKNRITEYGFLIDTDYIIVQSLTSPNLGTSKSRARRIIDYHLTLDTAKELAMVERNDKGRQVRRYFIECEKRLLKSQSELEPSIAEAEKQYRYLAKLIIHDNLFGGVIEIAGKANSVRNIASGIATDLGYKPTSFIETPMRADKIKRIQ
ncbi:antA/AntB antirepressor family protein [Enterobacteriaceae bacterium LUAb1]